MEQQESKARLLIVDDEKINLDHLVSHLRSNYQIIAAKDGAQAFLRLEKSPLPDLILLDIAMPGIDGYEVCRRLKENLRTKDIPVIFITASSDVGSEEKGFKCGAVDYITKPFHPSIVKARVKTQINFKRRGDLLEKIANYDSLTEISNRRKFDDYLKSTWEKSHTLNQSFSFIIMDIDFFKLYNDHYGHGEGDECLKKVAKVIERSMPGNQDLAARYGGEEFVCVLPDTDKTRALSISNQILNNIRNLNIPHKKSRVADHVTLSIGVTTVTFPTSINSTSNIAKVADDALYKAKNGGRNKIEFLDVSCENQ